MKLYNERQKYNTLDVSDFNKRKYLTWMTHYKLINFSQKEALTWKEKFAYDNEIKKLKEQKRKQEQEEAEQKNREELAKGKGKLDIIDENEELNDHEMPNLISDQNGVKVEVERDDNDQLHADPSGKTIEELKEQIRLEDEQKNIDDSKSGTSDISTKSNTKTNQSQQKSESELKAEATKLEEVHPSTKPKKDKMQEEMEKHKPKNEDDDDDGITDGMCYH